MRVGVGRTEYGYGVFAQRRFRRDQAVGEVHGRMIRDPDYSSHYGIDLGDDCTLEPYAPYRFLNHSCDPNCELIWIESLRPGEQATILLSAVRTVRPGDQLTIDYAWPADGAIPCLCGSSKCRGWIVDPAELRRLGGKKKLIGC
jgi:SET domain-containing protein